MAKGWSWCLFTACVAAACGDDGGNHQQQNDGGPRDTNGQQQVDARATNGVVRLYQGATAPPMVAAHATQAASLTSGKWYVSPDKVKVKLTRINFGGATPTGADLTDCTATYDRASNSMTALDDCPLSIDPGTYVSMNVFLDPVVEVFISDSTNGIYTDPNSATKLSATLPSGGAQFVSLTATLGTGFEQFFAQPLVVTADEQVTLSVLIDAVQSAVITVNGSSMTFGTYYPAVVFPSIGAPGYAHFYTSSGTGDSYNDDLVLANIVRVYYEGNGAPTVQVFQQRAGQAMGTCMTNVARILAHAADPSMTPALNNGDHMGGWLGKDSSNTMCWTYPANTTYTAFATYMRMPYVSNIGDTTTVHCEQNTNPTPPTSGQTYASGCPAMTNESASATLTLVAK